jgi:hypothetical protein
MLGHATSLAVGSQIRLLRKRRKAEEIVKIGEWISQYRVMAVFVMELAKFVVGGLLTPWHLGWWTLDVEFHGCDEVVCIMAEVFELVSMRLVWRMVP